MSSNPRLSVLLVGAVLLAATTASADEGGTWTRTESSTSFTSLLPNSCAGEDVQLVGTVQTVDSTRVDPSGAVDLKSVVSLSADGVGATSGAVYELTEITRETIEAVPLPFSLISTISSKLVGDGVPDQYVRFKIRLYIDENGVVTRQVSEFSLNCNP
jgi:hypothetical protein